MKRFVLYLVLVPIIGPTVRIALDDLIYGNYPFFLILQSFGVVVWVWTAYFNWLLPALAIATADWLVQFNRFLRLVIIAAMGWVSISATILLLYRIPPGHRWEPLFPGLSTLAGTITGPLCCLLIDQLNKDRFSIFGSAIRKAINFLRRWPNSI